jgi:hypothetical protein
LPSDKPSPKELKVTDKRIFTADGEIRDEFKNEIQPSDAPPPRAAEPPPPPPQPEPPKIAQAAPPQPQQNAPRQERRADSGRSVADRAANPDTPFTQFLEGLIMQAYMLLGMLRNPYQPQTKTDPAAARQLIDILTLLQEKTAGNLTPEETDFLETHLGELKLAYVQRTKSI